MPTSEKIVFTFLLLVKKMLSLILDLGFISFDSEKIIKQMKDSRI
jgi:hypothetical protein